ncbi:UrcA family protein [Sphingomonas sp. JC676]|uniref:UrcA family protein n=1 Tax=Sphingomonas sp. JC676 TaxID=2768065 RepID=UPI0016580699|nr:UrcA family protein [Sphingomonas sp. JC676]MBC9034891.1 UrcA family protein [Sphingomonas sp. JC676]
MTRGLFLAACAAGALLSPAARAEDWRDRETRSITVDSSALDLSTDAGVDELSRRIGRAVRRVCGSDRECQDEAWASTEGQVAWVVSHDEWMRRMADEHAAELMSCGGRSCAPPPRPVDYAPALAPAPPAMAAVIVTIVYGPPPVYRRY